MNRLLKYLKNEGVHFTLNKIWNKVFRHEQSHTVFLKFNGDERKIENSSDFKIEKLTERNKENFEEIKFWDFIHSEDFINNPKQSVLLIRAGKEYIAYAAEEHEQNREIHGLGSFNLKSDEGWIGPVYVMKKWRGHGLAQRLILLQMQNLRNIGVNTFFTAVNSNNRASLISFKNVGYSQIGMVDNKGVIVQDRLNILCYAFETPLKR